MGDTPSALMIFKGFKLEIFEDGAVITNPEEYAVAMPLDVLLRFGQFARDSTGEVDKG